MQDKFAKLICYCVYAILKLIKKNQIHSFIKSFKSHKIFKTFFIFFIIIHSVGESMCIDVMKEGCLVYLIFVVIKRHLTRRSAVIQTLNTTGVYFLLPL